MFSVFPSNHQCPRLMEWTVDCGMAEKSFLLDRITATVRSNAQQTTNTNTNNYTIPKQNSFTFRNPITIISIDLFIYGRRLNVLNITDTNFLELYFIYEANEWFKMFKCYDRWQLLGKLLSRAHIFRGIYPSLVWLWPMASVNFYWKCVCVCYIYWFHKWSWVMTNGNTFNYYYLSQSVDSTQPAILTPMKWTILSR